MNISDYIRLCGEHEHCEEGYQALIGCTCASEVFKLACTADGRSYLMESIRDGWGPSSEDIYAAFGRMAHGMRAVPVQTSEGITERVMMFSKPDYMYVEGCKEDERRVDVLIVIGAPVHIRIAEDATAIVYASPEARLTFSGHGSRAVVYDYGCEIGGTEGCNVRQINRRRMQP